MIGDIFIGRAPPVDVGLDFTLYLIATSDATAIGALVAAATNNGIAIVQWPPANVSKRPTNPPNTVLRG